MSDDRDVPSGRPSAQAPTDDGLWADLRRLTAALPARKRRRSMPVLKKPPAGPQPTHPQRRGRRLAVLVMASLLMR